MGTHPSITTQKFILQTVLQKRTCPPDNLLAVSQENTHVTEHVQCCPFCRERLGILKESPDLSEFVSILGGTEKGSNDESFIPKERMYTQSQNIEPAPGQIWSLKPHLAGWGPEAAYFNPPLVLILSLFFEPIKAVRVAQIFHEPDLAGPGDVQLSSRQGLAQAWNIYTLAIEDLDFCQEIIPNDRLEATVAEAGHSHPDPEPHSVLQAFRELELKTGHIMATRSLFSALALGNKAEKPRAQEDLLASLDPNSLRTHIQNAHPEIKLPLGQDLSPHHLLGLAQWTNLPLAAADAEEEITANCVWFDPDNQMHIAPAQAVITIMDISEQGLFIAGRLKDFEGQPEALHAWWVQDLTPHAADATSIAPEGTYFQVTFFRLTSDDHTQGKLKILIVGRWGIEQE